MLGGFMSVVQVTKACTAAELEAVNTVLITIPVPGDALIWDVVLTAADLDDGAGLVLDVGDAAGPDTPDDDRFIAASTVGQAGGTVRAFYDDGTTTGLLSLAPYQYSTTDLIEQEIEVTVNTAAATGAAGNLTCTVWYSRA